jgi:hypothetical protein
LPTQALVHTHTLPSSRPRACPPHHWRARAYLHLELQRPAGAQALALVHARDAQQHCTKHAPGKINTRISPHLASMPKVRCRRGQETYGMRVAHIQLARVILVGLQRRNEDVMLKACMIHIVQRRFSYTHAAACACSHLIRRSGRPINAPIKHESRIIIHQIKLSRTAPQTHAVTHSQKSAGMSETHPLASLLEETTTILEKVCEQIPACNSSSTYAQSGRLEPLQRKLSERLTECGWREELRELVR